MKIQYYYLRDIRCFAKGDGFNNCIYINGEWQPDRQNLVSDRLMGFDPFEDEDSPYRIGNVSVMQEIETISEQEFLERTQRSDCVSGINRETDV